MVSKIRIEKRPLDLAIRRSVMTLTRAASVAERGQKPMCRQWGRESEAVSKAVLARSFAENIKERNGVVAGVLRVGDTRACLNANGDVERRGGGGVVGRS